MRTRRAVMMAALVAAASGLAPSSASRAADPRTAMPRGSVAANWRLPATTRQLLVGIAADWDSSTVTLQRFERKGAKWTALGTPFPGRLGGKGLVWGRGINPREPEMSDKVEGDLRSPAGAFRLRHAFGYDEAWTQRTRLDYVTVGPRDLLVDDPSSEFYNMHVRLDHDPATAFERSQVMQLGDYAHRLQVMVEHNTTPRPIAGKGSAVLLHIWRNDGAKTTAGCTAMSSDDLEPLVAWLDPAKDPVYVLLPQSEYRARVSGWRLPAAPDTVTVADSSIADTTQPATASATPTTR